MTEVASLVLKAEPMTRVLIVVPRDHVPAAVEALYEMRILHVHDHKEGRDGLDLSKPLEGASETSEMLIRLRAMIATLGISDHTVDRPLPLKMVIKDLETKFDHLEEQVENLGENRSSLTVESRNIEQRLANLEPYISLGLDLEAYHPYESVEVMVGTATGDIFKAFDRTAIRYELFRPKDPAKAGLFALFVDTDQTDEAKAILGELTYTPIPVFEGEGDPREMRVQLKEGLAKVSASLEEVELDLKKIRKVHGDTLLAAEEHLSIEVEKAESPLRCGATPNVMFTEGWVPTPKLIDLEHGLRAAVGDAFHVEVLDDEDEMAGHGAAVAADGGEPDEGAKEEEEEHVDLARQTPVLLKNPESVKVHEYLVGLVSVPRYDEIDPAIFMYFTFPFFFAAMVGDVGYGILFILFGFYLLRSPWKGVGIVTGITRVRMTKMIMVSGAATILFGLLYGEMFGFELFGHEGIIWPHFLYVPSLDMYLPIHRLHEAMLMIKLCVWVGMAHLMLGLLIGFSNERKHHGAGHAFLAKFSWIFVLIGGYIVFAAYFSGAEMDIGGDPALTAGVVMLVGGLVLLLAGEGGNGILELPGLVSNVLSYTRLFAIGLSSMGIAMTFNSLGMLMAASGIAGAIAGVIVACLGHLINMFLALLAPSLHALRLHYVEWMTKFFAGGGTEYRPFGREREYTEV